ncbi:hypothetical protein BJ912DRAFT_1117767 [Pholiota molesta]|nr:hypothetical protein BJ912DRAFT_1117767 [Pholiota molesta]
MILDPTKDKLDGKSDAEGIDTTRALRKTIQEAPARLELLRQLPISSLSSDRHPTPLALERANQSSIGFQIRILQPRKRVYTPRRQLRTQRILHKSPPLHLLLLSLNFVILLALTSRRCSDMIYGLPATSYIAFCGPQISGELRRDDLNRDVPTPYFEIRRTASRGEWNNTQTLFLDIRRPNSGYAKSIRF